MKIASLKTSRKRRFLAKVPSERSSSLSSVTTDLANSMRLRPSERTCFLTSSRCKTHDWKKTSYSAVTILSFAAWTICSRVRHGSTLSCLLFVAGNFTKYSKLTSVFQSLSSSSILSRFALQSAISTRKESCTEISSWRTFYWTSRAI